jgi:hypothetical protein
MELDRANDSFRCDSHASTRQGANATFDRIREVLKQGPDEDNYVVTTRVFNWCDIGKQLKQRQSLYTANLHIQ